MQFKSTRLGLLELNESEIAHFPDGIYGFENEKKFVFLPFDKNAESPLCWMHSLQNPDLAFVVTDPIVFVPDYRVNLMESEKKEIGLAPGAAALIRVIINIPAVYVNMTANLVGPLVINPKTNVGKQFVLTNAQYDTKHYIFPEEVRRAAKSHA